MDRPDRKAMRGSGNVATDAPGSAAMHGVCSPAFRLSGARAAAAAWLVTALLAAASLPARAEGAGEQLFVEKCGMCHRAGGMGTGLLSRRYPKGQELLENRTNLSAALVTNVVRHGLQNMPALPRAEVSDAQLADITAYLSKGTP